MNLGHVVHDRHRLPDADQAPLAFQMGHEASEIAERRQVATGHGYLMEKATLHEIFAVVFVPGQRWVATANGKHRRDGRAIPVAPCLQ
ncbi:hypothetical protein ACF1BQ_004215 [Bradyrhizobium sp. RDT10]